MSDRKSGGEFLSVRHERTANFGRKGPTPALIQARDAYEACRPRDQAARARLAALSAMGAAMAHELSQPLFATCNHLEACLQRLRQKIDGLEELETMLADARNQASRASELVHRMRTFVTGGKVTGQRADLRDMLEVACANLRVFEGLEIARDFGSGATHALVDRLQIEMVLSNLLRNAAQAVADCAVRRITVSTSCAEGTIFVRIEDTGPGLSEECLDRMFEPLYTTKRDGTGLGLAICQAIVEAHGGALWPEKPQSEGGAIFMLALPAAPGEE